MRKPLAFTLMAIVIVLAGGALLWIFIQKVETVWTNDAQVEAYTSELSSNVTEQVTALFVHEGDYVEKGQIIAQLRSDVILSERAQAQAQVKQLEQQVMVYVAQKEKVEDDYVRALQGIKEEVISAQTFDHRQKDLEIANARVALALSELELARKTLEMVEAKLTHYTIYAPQSGIIANRWVWLGDTVSPGQTLYTLVDLEDVWVLARLSETKMAPVQLGDLVKIRVDAYPDYIFHGEIFAIKGAAASTFSLIPSNNATGNYTKVAQRVPIKMTIEPPDDFPKDQPLYLFPGMNVEVTIETRK